MAEPEEETENKEEEQHEKKPRKKHEMPLFRDNIIRKVKKGQQAKGPSPLKLLHEVFEETPDPNRFVGDTMFWKYFEDINIERIYFTNSVEYRNLWLMFHETFCYFAILIIFTVFVYNLQSMNTYEARQEQLDYWKGCDDVGSCRIYDVIDVESFWDWMRMDLIPLAFTQYAAAPQVAKLMTNFPGNDFSITMSPRFVGKDMSNVLLGTVRLRQLRVQKNVGCSNSLLVKHVYPDCYAAYSDAVKSETDYSSRFAPYYLMDAFTWKDTVDTRQDSMNGLLNSYPGDGFMVDLPMNNTDTLTMFNDLYQWRWLDRATRAVIIELSTLNVNVNVIVNTRILFEFGPTGTVLSNIKSNAAQVFYMTPSTKPGAGQTVFFLQIVILVLFVGYTIFTFYLVKKTCVNFIGQAPLKYMKKLSCTSKIGFLLQTLVHYFGYGWNLCDFAILALFYVHAFYRILAYVRKGAEPNLAPEIIGHPEYFMPFAQVLEAYNNGMFVLAVLAVVMWVKPFKYLCMVSWFRMLERIIEQTVTKLAIFSCLLVLFIFGFAVAFFVGFGDEEQRFSGLGATYLSLYFLLLDGYKINMVWFRSGEQYLMPLVFFLYIAILYFVLLNIFVAVVVDTYAMSPANTGSKPRINEGDRVTFSGPAAIAKELDVESHFLGTVLEVRSDDRADVDFGNGKRGVVEVSHLIVPNPMVVFINTYYHMVKGRKLKRVEVETNMRQEELSIRLELLPGLVRRKWIEKKRKMQKTASDCFAGLELFQDEDFLKENNRKAVTDWALPNTRLELEKMQSSSSQKPLSIYEIPERALKQEVSRAQLQRLMDEDETLKILLDADHAKDVIRRFKDIKDHDPNNHTLVDPSQVTRLQGQVFEKMDALENPNTDEEAPKHPQIHAFTEEMSSAITEVRNSFRIQLTSIIEATAALFEHLVDITQGIDAVRDQHMDILKIVKDNLGEDDED